MKTKVMLGTNIKKGEKGLCGLETGINRIRKNNE